MGVVGLWLVAGAMTDTLVLYLQLVHDGDISDGASIDDSDAHPPQRLCEVRTRGGRPGDAGECRESMAMVMVMMMMMMMMVVDVGVGGIG